MHRTDHRMHTIHTNSNICCPIQLLFQFIAQFLIFSKQFPVFPFSYATSQTEKKNIHKIFDDSSDGNDVYENGNGCEWCGGNGQRHQNFVSNAIISGETIHNKFNQKPLHPNGSKLSAFPRFLSSFGKYTQNKALWNCSVCSSVHFNELQANHFRHFIIIVWN